jgi:hypothetical protein
VPNEILVPAEIEARELEQPLPHVMEVLLPEPIRRAEHVGVRIILHLIASLTKRGDKPFRARIDAAPSHR